MRFADNGYYIERYIKCENCGVLIYDDGISVPRPDADAVLVCSPWCRDWFEQRARGVASPQIDKEF